MAQVTRRCRSSYVLGHRQEGIPSGRVLDTYLGGNLPGAPQYLTNNSSQFEYILLYFVD